MSGAALVHEGQVRGEVVGATESAEHDPLEGTELVGRHIGPLLQAADAPQEGQRRVRDVPLAHAPGLSRTLPSLPKDAWVEPATCNVSFQEPPLLGRKRVEVGIAKVDHVAALRCGGSSSLTLSPLLAALESFTPPPRQALSSLLFSLCRFASLASLVVAKALSSLLTLATLGLYTLARSLDSIRVAVSARPTQPLLQFLQLAEFLSLRLISPPASPRSVVALTVPTRNSSIPTEWREHDDTTRLILPLPCGSRLREPQGHNRAVADSPCGSCGAANRLFNATDCQTTWHRRERRVAVELDPASWHADSSRLCSFANLGSQEHACGLVWARDARSRQVSRLTLGVLDGWEFEEGNAAD